MKSLLRYSLLVLCFFVAQNRIARADCNTDCHHDPFNQTACYASCFLCQPEEPDGSCVSGNMTWTTCEEYWGCCPNWGYTGSTYVGSGQRPGFNACQHFDTYTTHYQDFGCGGTIDGCEEHVTSIESGWCFPQGTSC
jgi:hypothetical protein